MSKQIVAVINKSWELKKLSYLRRFERRTLRQSAKSRWDLIICSSHVKLLAGYMRTPSVSIVTVYLFLS